MRAFLLPTTPTANCRTANCRTTTLNPPPVLSLSPPPERPAPSTAAWACPSGNGRNTGSCAVGNPFGFGASRASAARRYSSAAKRACRGGAVP